MMAPTAEADLLAATWYPLPNDLIGGWCVMVTDATPSAGGQDVADFTTEGIARHIAELHNAALAPDRVAVSRDDLATILGEAEGFIGGKDNAAFSRLAAAAGVA